MTRNQFIASVVASAACLVVSVVCTRVINSHHEKDMAAHDAWSEAFDQKMKDFRKTLDITEEEVTDIKFWMMVIEEQT